MRAVRTGEDGILLAVRTGDGSDDDADLVHVTVLGQRILSRAG